MPQIKECSIEENVGSVIFDIGDLKLRGHEKYIERITIICEKYEILHRSGLEEKPVEWDDVIDDEEEDDDAKDNLFSEELDNYVGDEENFEASFQQYTKILKTTNLHQATNSVASRTRSQTPKLEKPFSSDDVPQLVRKPKSTSIRKMKSIKRTQAVCPYQLRTRKVFTTREVKTNERQIVHSDMKCSVSLNRIMIPASNSLLLDNTRLLISNVVNNYKIQCSKMDFDFRMVHPEIMFLDEVEDNSSSNNNSSSSALMPPDFKSYHPRIKFLDYDKEEM